MTSEFFWNSSRISISFVNSDQNFIIYRGAGIFQELRSEFRLQKQLASLMCSSLLVKEGILRVHPDLAGRHAEAGQLTSESTGGFMSECIFS